MILVLPRMGCPVPVVRYVFDFWDAALAPPFRKGRTKLCESVRLYERSNHVPSAAERAANQKKGAIKMIKMLCTPIVLGKAKVSMRERPILMEHPSTGNVDSQLEQAKERVGVFKIKRGDAAWKERVEKVDRMVNMRTLTTAPVSRAYFKLVEILRTCAIRVSGRSLHLCEAPGGFVQAVIDETNCNDIRAMSRRCGGAAYFSLLISRADRVHILDDLPHSSDLMCKDVRDEVVERSLDSDLITADGAFDNDARPEVAEAMTATLILHEIDTATRAQKKGGTFVLKIFGLALNLTRECIAILTTCYETVSIVKPFTSRIVNDERYIVCQNFTAPPQLPTIPDQFGLYIDSIATVDEEWMQSLQQVIHDMRIVQRQAIHSALTCTLRDDTASRRPFPPRRSGQKGGRGTPYQRGRGRLPNRESQLNNTTR